MKHSTATRASVRQRTAVSTEYESTGMARKNNTHYILSPSWLFLHSSCKLRKNTTVAMVVSGLNSVGLFARAVLYKQCSTRLNIQAAIGMFCIFSLTEKRRALSRIGPP
jgi:hypothetical protein